MPMVMAQTGSSFKDLSSSCVSVLSLKDGNRGDFFLPYSGISCFSSIVQPRAKFSRDGRASISGVMFSLFNMG